MSFDKAGGMNANFGEKAREGDRIDEPKNGQV
jgi:hypothetical protein